VINALLKKLFFHFGLLSLIRRFYPRKTLAVLRYHAVCKPDRAYASPWISVTPEGFRNQIRYLSKHYPILDLDEAVGRIQSGQTLPDNAVAITFDDGYQDNFAAAQTLMAYGATATFFITTHCIDDREVFWVSELRYLISKTRQVVLRLPVRGQDEDFGLESPRAREAAISKLTRIVKSCTIPERESLRAALRERINDVGPLCEGQALMLSQKEIETMIAGGMKMGGHTLTHCNLPSAGREAARKEIAQCRRDLEKRFNTAVTTFAYPNGGANAYFNEEIKMLVKDAGFHSAWTSQHGYVDANTDWWQSPRLAVTESLVELIYLMEGDRLRTDFGNR